MSLEHCKLEERGTTPCLLEEPTPKDGYDVDEQELSFFADGNAKCTPTF